MFQIFTLFADWLAYSLLGLSPETQAGEAVHFFIEDTTKIFALLFVMIYVIAILRASLDVERVRSYLAGKHKLFGYFSGALFGTVTPFCSCSSIPVFLGFSSAGIPLGITMAFLITSPLVNEIAIVLLLSLLGWKFTLLYLLSGLTIGMLGGYFLDLIKAERWLVSFAAKAIQEGELSADIEEPVNLTLKQRHEFAKNETQEIFRRVWKWVFIGVGLGAALHGFVPDGWIEAHLGDKQWWSVPVAVAMGIPLYSNATGIIPVMESLITNGLPIGTTLAFCMSTVAASFPEFILLKQVMQWRLLVILFFMLLSAFTLLGWLFNLTTF